MALIGVLVSFSAAGYTVSEGDGVVELTLLINGSTSYEFSLYLSTADKSAMGIKHSILIMLISLD